MIPALGPVSGCCDVGVVATGLVSGCYARSSHDDETKYVPGCREKLVYLPTWRGG